MPKEFAEWKNKFSKKYADNGLLDLIEDVATEITQSHVRHAATTELSNESKKYLSDNFGIDLNNRPSVIEFLTYDFLSDVIGLTEHQLTGLCSHIANPTTIELLFLERFFSLKELKPSLDKLTKSLHSLIDEDALHEAFGPELKIEVSDDKFILNQIAFCYGAPLFAAAPSGTDEIQKKQIRDNLEALYHEMTRHETNANQVIDDLISNQDHLPKSLSDFFDELPAKILSREELDVSPENLQLACNAAKEAYLEFYQRNKAPFLLFRSPINRKVSAEAIAIIETTPETGDERLPDATMSAIKEVTGENFQKIFKLSHALFQLSCKQNLLPEISEFLAGTVTLKFTSELLKQRYVLEGRGRYETGDHQMDEVFGFLMESFMSASLKEVHDLEGNLEKLRSEIKSLKTKREISDKAAEYVDSGLHLKTLEVVQNYLEPFLKVVKENLPHALATCGDSVFEVCRGLESIITQSSKISQNFAEKYQEVRGEIDEAADKKQKEAAEQQQKNEEELKKIHLEIQKQKEDFRSSSLSKRNISFEGRTLTNGGIIEAGKKFSGDKTFADETFTRDSYDVYVTKEINQLIKDADPKVRQALLVAIDSGFLHAKSRGNTGIKPMDHSEKVNGYVIVETKLTGSTIIGGTFLGDSGTTMGDVRFCGVLKDGILLITHATLHGEENRDLQRTAAEIKKHIEEESIAISEISPRSKLKPGGTSALASEGRGRK